MTTNSRSLTVTNKRADGVILVLDIGHKRSNKAFKICE